MEILSPRHWLDYARRNRLRILMYHSIADAPNDRLAVTPEMFHAQMCYLADNQFQVISLQSACELLALPTWKGNRTQTNHVLSKVEGTDKHRDPSFFSVFQRSSVSNTSFPIGIAQTEWLKAHGDLRKKIVLTFDDGYADFLTTAAPILKTYGFPATLFVVTGRGGETARWSTADKTRRTLSADELREVKALGFALGSHTATHADLTTLDATVLDHELCESRAAIAKMGEAFIPLAYPGGRFTRRERDAAERAEYDSALIVGGRWGKGAETDLFLLKREPMLASDSLDWFARRVNGYYEFHYLWARARGIETR